MAPPLLLDLTHTCHTRARTGIQRVTRGLYGALGPQAFGLTYDPHWRAWRGLEPWEEAGLTGQDVAGARGARWPLRARVRGLVRRHLRVLSPPFPADGALIVPEVFSAATGRALPALLARVRGLRVAVFHDAIALQYPELSPRKTVARFPAYLDELRAFDGIAAVSEDSRSALLGYWNWLGVSRLPPVVTVPLAVEVPARTTAPAAGSADVPVILCVGSIEGRKNHVALLRACADLWDRGEKFMLHLVGLAQAETGAEALNLLRTLQAAGRPLRYDGPVSDAAVAAAYAGCTFTVYPSLKEGFGLPVLESLAHGKPCLCSARGALGEAARGGGGMALDSVDAPSLAHALSQLLANPEELRRLAAAARQRPQRSWRDYARDLQQWMSGLRRRD